MTLDHCFSLAQTLASFAGLVFVGWQIRDGIKKAGNQSLDRVHDTTRILVILGFFKPELFTILDDKPADPTVERRYLQLWFNLYLEIHAKSKDAMVTDEHKDSLIRDMTAVLAQKNMQRFWAHSGRYYPALFRQLVDDIIQQTKENEPPPSTGMGPAAPPS